MHRLSALLILITTLFHQQLQQIDSCIKSPFGKTKSEVKYGSKPKGPRRPRKITFHGNQILRISQTASYQPQCSSATIFHSQPFESKKTPLFFYVWTTIFRLNQLVNLATSIFRHTNYLIYIYCSIHLIRKYQDIIYSNNFSDLQTLCIM